METVRPSLASGSFRHSSRTWAKPCSVARLGSRREGELAAKGKKSNAPETRCRPDTHAVDGRRISNSSAERLRYFGRVFFAAALDIEGNSIIASQRSNPAM